MEELNAISLNIRNAIDTVEWHEDNEDLVLVTELLREAEHILDSYIMNEL